jgi:hypothetical protein
MRKLKPGEILRYGNIWVKPVVDMVGCEGCYFHDRPCPTIRDTKTLTCITVLQDPRIETSRFVKLTEEEERERKRKRTLEVNLKAYAEEMYDTLRKIDAIALSRDTESAVLEIGTAVAEVLRKVRGE